MKKISYVLSVFVLLFSLTAHADKKVTRDMLDQVWTVTSGFKPVVGDAVYSVKKKTASFVVIRFYDGNHADADPGKTDMQAVFLKTKVATTLVAITFSPIDVTQYIDLLVE